MLPAHPNEPAPEAPRRRFRKLRIAWSVGWGVVAVLLVVLWVRSYWRVDGIYIAHSHSAVSIRGDLYIDAGVAGPASLGPSKHDYGSHVTHSTWTLGKGVVLNEQRGGSYLGAYVADIHMHSRTLAPLPFLPPHTANRDDAGCGGAGADRAVAVMRSGGFILRGTNMDYQDPGEKPCGPYQGMTVNERLFAAGQFEAFEKAATNRDEDAMVSILMAVDITKLHAKRIAGEIIENPKQFGY